MEITCPKCSVTTKAEGVSIEVQQFSCPACGSLSDVKGNGSFNFIRKFDFNSPDIVLKVGQKGNIKGVEYTVTGVVVKKVQKHYFWREYILTAEKDEQLYLSETDGHWILLRKVDDEYKVRGYPKQYSYNDMALRLYDYDDPTTVMAAGFFDYDVLPNRQRMIEYINPPYIFSVEEINNEQTAYFGEHISRATIKKAFGIKTMPSKSGTGIVQPFVVSIRQMAIVFCLFAIIILLTHFFVYKNRQSITVLQDKLTLSEYNGKDYVSNPFTLTGGSAPLTIGITTGVDNSWAAVDIGLINEKTNTEEYTSKDIEYYHGYEGGENWSEGKNYEDVEICGVGAGTYHLVITPQKPPEDISNNWMDVSAVWSSPSSWNMIIPILSMLGVGLLMFALNFNFERNRWMDSSYSPYE